METTEVILQARSLFVNVAQTLAEAGATPEQLAITIPARRLLGFIPRPQSYRRAGEGFLIGAFFVTSSGNAYEPGQIVRATRQVAPDHQSQNAQLRKGLKDKLLGARFPENSTVLIDARLIRLDDPGALALEQGPLVLVQNLGMEAALMVRWMPSAPDAGLRLLGEYLDERLALALQAIEDG